MPRRYRELARRGVAQWSELARRSGWIAAHFALPAPLVYLALSLPEWREFVWFQPDLTYWLSAAATVVCLKGVIESALVWRIFAQSREGNIQARQSARKP